MKEKKKKKKKKNPNPNNQEKKNTSLLSDQRSLHIVGKCPYNPSMQIIQ